jgi:hypothetical protein
MTPVASVILGVLVVGAVVMVVALSPRGRTSTTRRVGATRHEDHSDPLSPGQPLWSTLIASDHASDAGSADCGPGQDGDFGGNCD